MCCGVRPTFASPVEAPRLGYADESERADAKATLVKRLPDSGGTPATGFYNLVMAGDSGVGKSSLLLRFSAFSDAAVACATLVAALPAWGALPVCQAMTV